MSRRSLRFAYRISVFPVAVIFALFAMSIGAAQAQTTLYVHSQPGDSIGKGVDSLVTSPSYTVAITDGNDGSLRVSLIQSSGGQNSWYLSVTGSDGAPVTVGNYSSTTSNPANTTAPVLILTGNAAGCNGTGSFSVLELVRDASHNVTQLAIDFVYRCGAAAPSAIGQFRFNSLIGLSASPVSEPLTLALQGSGTGSVQVPATSLVICSSSPCNLSYLSGNDLILNAGANSGVFAGWSGVNCAGGNSNPACEFTMPATPLNIVATFSLQLLAQSITFNSPGATFTLGSGPVSLVAQTGSLLPVAFSSLTPSVCSVSGNSATLLTTGLCTIRATQPGNSVYAAASPVDASFYITSGAPAAGSYTGLYYVSVNGDDIGLGRSDLLQLSDFVIDLQSTYDNGIQVTLRQLALPSQHWTMTVGDTAPLTVRNYPNATQFGSNAAAGLSVTVNHIACGAVAGSFAIRELQRDSNGAITQFALDFAQYCAGPSPLLGQFRYNSTVGFSSFPNVAQLNLTYSGPGQGVTYASGCTTPCALNQLIGSPITLNAPTTPIGQVFQGWSGVNCSGGNTGNTCAFTFNGPTTVNMLYGLALPVAQTISISGLQPSYTLSSGSVTLPTSASSGLPITYATQTPSICSISGHSAVLLALGTCSIQATQAGDAIYAAAPPVSFGFNVVTQVLITTYTNVGVSQNPVYVGFNVTLNAWITNTPFVLPTGTVTIKANGVPLAGCTNIPAQPAISCAASFGVPGYIIVSADYSGDSLYAPSSGNTTVHVVAAVPDAPQNLNCAAGSNQALCSFGVPQASGASAISGYTITCHPSSGGGADVSTSGSSSPLSLSNMVGGLQYTCSVVATNAQGSGDPSNLVFLTPAVPLLSQTIAPPALAASYPVSTGSVTLAASASSGLSVTYSSLTSAVCSVSGNTVTLLAAGTCTVHMIQAGNATYAAAAPADISFAVTAVSAPLTSGLYVQSVFGDYLGHGANTLRLSPPWTIQITEPSNGVITVFFTQASPFYQQWFVQIRSVTGSLAVGNYPNALDSSMGVGSTTNGLYFSGASTGCGGNPPGKFTVLELARDNSGAISQLAIDFEAGCTNAPLGQVRYNSTFGFSDNPSLAAIDVTYTGPGSGATLSGLNCTTPCHFNGRIGSAISLEFNFSGEDFIAWSGVTCAEGNSSPTCTFTVTGAVSVNATFKAPLIQQFIAPPFVRYSYPVGVGSVAIPTTASSGLPVTFTSLTPVYCSVSGTFAILLAPGLCNIQVTQPGDSVYAAAQPASIGFIIVANASTLSSTTLFVSQSPVYIGASVTLTALVFASPTPSTGTVTFKLDGVPITGCANLPLQVNGTLCPVSFGAAGTFSVVADYSGDLIYAPSSGSLSVSPIPMVPGAPQNLNCVAGNRQVQCTFNAPQVVGASPVSSYTLTCHPTPSGAAIVVNGNASPLVAPNLVNGVAYDCAVNAANAQGAGAASSVLTVTPVGTPQTITVSALQPSYPVTAGNVTLTASASSGLPVTAASTTPAFCSISGNTIALLAVGTCTIQLTQSGNAAYAAAAPVNSSFSITVLTGVASTTSVSASVNPVVVGASVTLSASVSASPTPGNGSVTFSANGAPLAGCTNIAVQAGIAQCTASFASAGSYAIVAAYSGSVTYLASNGSLSLGVISSPPSAPQNLSCVAGLNQVSCSFGAPQSSGTSQVSGYTVACSPTASGSSVTAGGAGSPIVLGNMTGGAQYSCTATASNGQGSSAASNAVLVTPTAPIQSQTITPPALAASYPLTAGPVAVTASASSGLPVAYGSLTPALCSVTGSNVTLLNLGTCSIQLTQAGNAGYSAAVPINLSISIVAPTGLTSATNVTSASNAATVGANMVLTAIVSGTPVAVTGSVTFSASSVSIAGCTNLPLQSASATCNTSFAAAGTYNIVAAYSGSNSYLPSNGSFGVTVTAVVPNAPVGLLCIGGIGSALCSFSAPQFVGASPIVGYTVICSLANGAASGIGATGSSSPITVTGLATGVLYNCTATATNAQGTSVASQGAFVIATSSTARQGSTDANGDGKAEVVVRTSTGNSYSGTLNNQNKLVFTNSPDPGTGWTILGTGDFSGSGRSDLLMQETSTGTVKVWRGFEGPPDGEFILRTVKPGWVVAAITDIDGDGKADIIWRFYSTPANPSPNPDDNGVVFVWFMNGTQVDQVAARGGAPVSWQYIGAADLHGNGRGDMIWVSPAGAIRCITALPNRAYVNELIGNLPTGYSLIKTGDFDGDGKADLLFRDAAGHVKLSTMNGIQLRTEYNLPDTSASWSLYALGDLNGDGTMDIVWLLPDGSLTLWLMSHNTPATPTVISNAGNAPAGASAIGK